MVYPIRSTPRYLSFQDKMDHVATLIGPSFVKGFHFTNPDKNTLMSLQGSLRAHSPEVPRNGLTKSQKEALKPLKILNRSLRRIGVKRKAWIPFILNSSKPANKQMKTLGDSMIGSILFFKNLSPISYLRA
jgi:hypothetical protein